MPPAPPRSPEEAVERIPEGALLATDQEVLAQWCLLQLGWPSPDEERVRIGHLHDHSSSSGRLVIHVPLLTDSSEFEREGHLLQPFHAWGYASCGPTRVAVQDFTIDNALADDPSTLKKAISLTLEAARAGAEEQAASARHRLERARSEALAQIRTMVARRVAVATATSHAKVELGIPLTQDSPASPLPVQPVGLNLEIAMARASSGTPELTLEAAVRESILGTIRSFTAALERLPTTANRLAELDEEALRDVLLFIVNANWHVATGEAFSGAGKTDIQLQFNGRVAFTAELKIYSGPQAIMSAIDQVCSYLVWRDTHAALVVFIRDRKDVAAAIQRVQTAVKTHARYIRPAVDVADRFVLATDDSTRTIVLDLITVPL